MAAMPLREWTRRLGALPAEAYDCFMVGTLYGFNRNPSVVRARLLVANGRLSSGDRVVNHLDYGQSASVLAFTKDKPLKNEITKNGAKASNSKMASRSSKCRLTTSPSHPVTQSDGHPLASSTACNEI